MAYAASYGRTTEPLQLGPTFTHDARCGIETSSPLESLIRQSSLKANQPNAKNFKSLNVTIAHRMPGQPSFVFDNGRDALDTSQRLHATLHPSRSKPSRNLLFEPSSPLIHSGFRNSTATSVGDTQSSSVPHLGPDSYLPRISVASQYSNEGDDTYEYAGIMDRFNDSDDTGGSISPASHRRVLPPSFCIENVTPSAGNRPISDASSVLPLSVKGLPMSRTIDSPASAFSSGSLPSERGTAPVYPTTYASSSSPLLQVSHGKPSSPPVPPTSTSPPPSASSTSVTRHTRDSSISTSVARSSDLFAFRDYESQASERTPNSAAITDATRPVAQEPSESSSASPSTTGRSLSQYNSGRKHNFSRPLRVAETAQPPPIPSIQIDTENVDFDVLATEIPRRKSPSPISETDSHTKSIPVPPSDATGLKPRARRREAIGIPSTATYQLVMENWAKDADGRPVMPEGSVQLQAPYQHSADPRRPSLSALQYHPKGPNAPNISSSIPPNLTPNANSVAANRTLSPITSSESSPHGNSARDSDQASLYSNYSYYGVPGSPHSGTHPKSPSSAASTSNSRPAALSSSLGAQAAAAALRPVLVRTPSNKSAMSSSNPTSVLPDGLPKSISGADEYLQLGIQHHETDNLPLSAYCFEHSAKFQGGCGVGMLMWGLTLRHGWGVPKDEQKGFLWVRRAAEAAVNDLDSVINGVDAGAVKTELVLAIYEVGQCYSNGWGVLKDKKMAVSYFQVAARLGDPDAQQELGFCYANGKGCKKNKKEAAKWYRKAADQGISTVGLAWIYKEKYR